MKLAILKNSEDGEGIIISSSPYVIGRCRDADFIIAHVNVSRNHCNIVMENDSWKINDYSSSGTYVNNILVGRGESVILNNGDLIRFGPIESNLCWSFYSFDFITENLGSTVESNTTLDSESKNCDLVNGLIKTDSGTSSEENNLNCKNIDIIFPGKTEFTEDKKSENEKIQELTKELQQVQKALSDLEEKNSALQQSAIGIVNQNPSANTDLLENLADLMESELQCSICSELFVTAVTLGCTHTFCLYCINQWKKKQKTCPICRKKITQETRSLVVDNYIDKMVGNLSLELKERRETVIKERNETEPSRKRSKHKHKNN